MKVLIVDDSKAMRLMIKRALRQSGFSGLETIEASDGTEGLEKAQSQKPEVIISDWNMPNMSGMDLLKALRAADHPARFGFITTETTADARERALNEGASFMLTKPFTVETFREALAPMVRG
ncbi:MAG TPA: response regulator [Gammaproteobacteria bacterium]|nr:response regulator [Gammaproteobacteria bacterium]MCH79112.1 response regulator [Gammaproteobacteria bacterium]